MSVRSREDDFEDEPLSQRQRTDDEADAGSHFSASQGDDDWHGCSQTDNPTVFNSSPLPGEPILKHEKGIHDRVHGQVNLHGLLVAVMDTAEFQRLDSIMQLGGCSFVCAARRPRTRGRRARALVRRPFARSSPPADLPTHPAAPDPSAKHTRKEHSIGVAFLAGEMARHLQSTQPELNISNDDVLCVELAGLVHDLGHGPYSHMWETFIEKLGSKMDHEDMSGLLLRHLVRKNGIPLEHYFSADASTCEEHINFVIKLIQGLKDAAPWPADVGRDESKRFLFEIVSNSRNGIDVDKLDYLVRDSMAAFGSSKPPGLDVCRIIFSSRVIRNQICFQEKVMLDVNEICSLRAKLHRQVYQHRISNVAEAMITDIFLAANASFRLERAPSGARGWGQDGEGGDEEEVRTTTLAEAALREEDFARLTDALIDAIGMYTPADKGGLKEAKELICRLRSRRFYKQVGETVQIPTLPACTKCGKDTQFEHKFCSNCGKSTKFREKIKVGEEAGEPVYQTSGSSLSAEEAKEQILELCDRELVKPDDLHVHIVKIEHGKRTTKKDWHGVRWQVYDPLANVGFYNPKEPVGEGGETVLFPTRDKLPEIFLPSVHQMKTLYCYLKQDSPAKEVMENVANALESWKQKRSYRQQIGASNNATPSKADRRTPSGTPASAGGGGAKGSFAARGGLDDRFSASQEEPLGTIAEAPDSTPRRSTAPL